MEKISLTFFSEEGGEGREESQPCHNLFLFLSLSFYFFDFMALTNDGPCDRTENPSADTGGRWPSDRANTCAHSRKSQPLSCERPRRAPSPPIPASLIPHVAGGRQRRQLAASLCQVSIDGHIPSMASALRTAAYSAFVGRLRGPRPFAPLSEPEGLS